MTSSSTDAGGESIGASFRDPSGFIFEHEGVVHRQVNQCYARHYDHLMESGLYESLVSKQLLIPHKETLAPRPPSSEHARTLYLMRRRA